MITGEKRDALERWLFNFTEPPFTETYNELAQQYEENLRELHRVEQAEWSVEDLVCTPDEIRDVVNERLKVKGEE